MAFTSTLGKCYSHEVGWARLSQCFNSAGSHRKLQLRSRLEPGSPDVYAKRASSGTTHLWFISEPREYKVMAPIGAVMIQHE